MNDASEPGVAGHWAPPSPPLAPPPAPVPASVPPASLPSLPSLPPASNPTPAVVPPMPVHEGLGGVLDRHFGLDVAARRAEIERGRRRRARVFTSIVLLFVIAGCAGVALVVMQQRERAAERVLPDGPLGPYGSRSVAATERTVFGGVTQVGKYYVDLSSSVLYYDGVEGDLADLLYVDGRWFIEDAGAWYSFVPPIDDVQEQTLFLQADGFSVDEAVPASTRPFVDYVDVEDVTYDDRPMRRFDLVVRDADMKRSDPAAFAEFLAVWGEQSVEQPDDLPENVRIVGINLSLWVDEAGWVWRWESKADFNSDSIEVTIDELSTEPYVFPAPVDGQPVTGPFVDAAPSGTVPVLAPATVPPLTIPPVAPVFGTAAP